MTGSSTSNSTSHSPSNSASKKRGAAAGFFADVAIDIGENGSVERRVRVSHAGGMQPFEYAITRFVTTRPTTCGPSAVPGRSPMPCKRNSNALKHSIDGS